MYELEHDKVETLYSVKKLEPIYILPPRAGNWYLLYQFGKFMLWVSMGGGKNIRKLFCMHILYSGSRIFTPK